MMIKTAKGRPEEKRTYAEETVYDFLDSLEINYERADHEAAQTMEDCRIIGEYLGVNICKNLFLCNRQKTRFYLLLMPGNKEFRTKNLSAQINSSRLSFADAAAMLEMIGTQPGSASIMSLIFDKENRVSLLIDKDVLSKECMNTTSLKISMRDLEQTIVPALSHEPTIVEL